MFPTGKLYWAKARRILFMVSSDRSDTWPIVSEVNIFILYSAKISLLTLAADCRVFAAMARTTASFKRSLILATVKLTERYPNSWIPQLLVVYFVVVHINNVFSTLKELDSKISVRSFAATSWASLAEQTQFHIYIKRCSFCMNEAICFDHTSPQFNV